MILTLKNTKYLNEGKYDSEISRIGKDLLKIFKVMIDRTIKASSLNIKKNFNTFDLDSLNTINSYIFKDKEDITINFNNNKIDTTLILLYHYNQNDNDADFGASVNLTGTKLEIKLVFPFYIMALQCLKNSGLMRLNRDYDFISTTMQNLSHQLTAILAHELTHIIQISQNKDVHVAGELKPQKKSLLGYNKNIKAIEEYYTSKSEIEAYTSQFYKLAKRKKIPFSTVLKKYTFTFIDSYEQTFFNLTKNKKKRENISLELKDIFSRFFFACINLADQKYPKAQIDSNDIQEVKNKLF